MKKIIKICSACYLFWGNAIAYVGTIAEDAKRVEDLAKAGIIAKKLNDLQGDIHDTLKKVTDTTVLQALINDFKEALDTARSLAIQVVTWEKQLNEFKNNLAERQSKAASDATKSLGILSEALSALYNKAATGQPKDTAGLKKSLYALTEALSELSNKAHKR